MKETEEILIYNLVLHRARKKLNIKVNEYCIADSIYHLSHNPKSEIQGWCYASKETLGELLSITPQAVWGILKKLFEKKIIEKNKDDRRYLRTTQKWYDTVILMKLKMREQHKESLDIIKKDYEEHKESLDSKSNKHKETLDNKDIHIYKYNNKDKKLAELLYNLIKERNPAWYNKPDWDKWSEDIRKIREIDNRTPEQIEFVIRWCQNDEFWCKNILSPSKLRKQFNNLVVKIQPLRKGNKIGIAM